MHRHAWLICVLTFTATIAPAAGAAAATPSTVFAPFATPNPEPQAGARWGERLVAVNDENADGVNDFFMATPFVDLSYPNQGRVYLMSGKDRSIIRVIDAPEPQGGTAFGFSATGGASFGFYISSPGDLNADGRDDVVVGTDAQNVYTGAARRAAPPSPTAATRVRVARGPSAAPPAQSCARSTTPIRKALRATARASARASGAPAT